MCARGACRLRAPVAAGWATVSDRVLDGKQQGRSMKQLQLRYSALQGFNFVATCAACAFVAIFLQYKGFDNTLIGVTTAGACVFSIFLGPVLSALLQKIASLTIPRVFDITFALMCVTFVAIAYLPLPDAVIMLVYVFVYAMLMCTPPLLSQVAMGYVRRGQALNFGLARGTGSIAYAITAVVVSSLVGWFSPLVIAPVFVASSVIVLWLIHTLPGYTEEVEPAGAAAGEKGSAAADAADKPVGFVGFVFRYRLLMFVLLGFCLNFIAASSLSTYLINIAQNLGGDTATLGIGTFCMAASELPMMTIMPKLRRKLGTGGLFMLVGVAYIIRNCLICLAPSIPMLFVGLMFQGLSYGIMMSLIAYYVAEECGVADEMLGQTFIAVMTTGIGSSVGNFAGGVLQDSLGLGAMLSFSLAVTFAGSAVLLVAGVIQRRREGIKKSQLQAA